TRGCGCSTSCAASTAYRYATTAPSPRLIYEAKVGSELEFVAERNGESFEGVIVLEEEAEREDRR
ncbi:MAG: hypothetical protein ABIF77_00725, partial [bacterium]